VRAAIVGARRPCRIAVEALEPRSLLALDGPGAPAVTTLAASDVTATSATLSGSVNPNGMSTDTVFQVSTDPTLPANVVTTLAGAAGQLGDTDGTGSAARLFSPIGVGLDLAGNVYTAEDGGNTIRKITPAGVVTTLAGTAGVTGGADGTGPAAQFETPFEVAVDNAGNVYVADVGNDTIRKVTPGGVVTTLAGMAGVSESADGTGSSARFAGPSAVAVDGAGNVYVADTGNNTIRKITPGGMVTTLAGNPAASGGSADGTGSAARFDFPAGVAVDGAGNVYVADSGNDTIRKITPDGVITTFAGSAN
jgi:sugar lactone lactonase YvrE